MEESVKLVIIHEDDVPSNGDEGFELGDLVESEVTRNDQSENSNVEERAKLDDNDDDNLTKSDDDRKNGEFWKMMKERMERVGKI